MSTSLLKSSVMGPGLRANPDLPQVGLPHLERLRPGPVPGEVARRLVEGSIEESRVWNPGAFRTAEITDIPAEIRACCKFTSSTPNPSSAWPPLKIVRPGGRPMLVAWPVGRVSSANVAFFPQSFDL